MKYLSTLILSIFFICSLCTPSVQAADKSSPLLIPAYKNGKGGYINYSGKFVIPPSFDYVADFSENLATIGMRTNHSDISYGVIDNKGRVVVKPIYTGVSEFSEGIAYVNTGIGRNRKMGYITKTGKVLIPPSSKYYGANLFKNGFGILHDGLGNCRYVDRNGKMSQWFVSCGEFDKLGTARAAIGTEKDRKYGVINSSWKFVIQPQYKTFREYDENGLAYVSKGIDYRGFIDRSGKVVIEFSKDDIFPHDGFREGLLPYRKLGQPLFGYIDINKNYVLQPTFQAADLFHNGLAIIQESDGKHYWQYGVIDKQGNVIIKPEKFIELFPFSEGLAVAKSKENGKYGYTNLKGEFVIPPQFGGYCEPFKNGLAIVSMDLNGPWGLINQNGQWVLKPEYKFIQREKTGVIRAGNNNVNILLNYNGTKMIYKEYR